MLISCLEAFHSTISTQPDYSWTNNIEGISVLIGCDVGGEFLFIYKAIGIVTINVVASMIKVIYIGNFV